MSTQVYASGGRPADNRIISELITAPGGDIVVNSITLTAQPSISGSLERCLVRDTATGLVKRGGMVEVDELVGLAVAADDIFARERLFLSSTPPATPSVVRCLARDVISGEVGNGNDIVMDRLTLALVPAVDAGGGAVLVRNVATGVIEQRSPATIPESGFTSRFVGGNQTIPDSTDTPITYPLVAATDALGVSYNAGTGEFTVLRAGNFNISWTTVWKTAALGVRWTWLNLSISGTLRYGNINGPANAASLTVHSSSTSLALPVGAVFVINCFQDSGGPVNVAGTGTEPNDVSNINIVRVTIA